MDKKYDFETLKNKGELETMHKLIDLKNIFAKQLPKMPKEYIVRLVFDSKHESIVIRDSKGTMFGGITYCLFPNVHLCEIVFLAISSDQQIKGFGTILMNKLKTNMQDKSVAFLMTCADNLAIGYFQKQGFHLEIQMPSHLYQGYLKDYEGSTLMECLLDNNVDYSRIGEQIKQFKATLHSEIEQKIQNNVEYPGLIERKCSSNGRRVETSSVTLKSIPGLARIVGIENELIEVEKSKTGSCFRNSCLKIVEQLKNHKSAWAFLNAVKKEEVPDYYDVILSPMWLTRIEEKVNDGNYEHKQDFINDLNLIVTNCRMYNQKNTIYYKGSLDWEIYMHSLLSGLRDDSENGKTQINPHFKLTNQKPKKIKNN